LYLAKNYKCNHVIVMLLLVQSVASLIKMQWELYHLKWTTTLSGNKSALKFSVF